MRIGSIHYPLISLLAAFLTGFQTLFGLFRVLLKTNPERSRNFGSAPPATRPCLLVAAAPATVLPLLLAVAAERNPKPTFVRIEGASVSVREYVIIAHIHLHELPSTLPYNAPDLTENRLEYEWRVVFDVDGDNSWANDIAIVLAHFKFPGAEPRTGAVTDFAQQSVVKADESGQKLSVIAASTVHQEGDALVLGVAKREHPELLAIDRSTPWRVRAYVDQGQAPIVEHYPANGGYFLPQAQ
jgi:hypothetical protein